MGFSTPESEIFNYDPAKRVKPSWQLLLYKDILAFWDKVSSITVGLNVFLQYM